MRKFFTTTVLAAVAMCAPQSVGAVTLSISATPESGSTVESLSKIYVDTADPDYTDIDVLSQDLIYVNKDGAKFCDVTCDFNWTSYKLEVTLATQATEPGTYEVVFPEGAIELMNTDTGAELTGDASLTYIIAGAVSDPFKGLVTVTPAQGEVQSLTKIDLDLVESVVDKYEYFDIVTASKIKVLKDGVDFCGVNSSYFGDTGSTLTLKTPATEPGTYTVQMPEDAWLLQQINSFTSEAWDVTLTYTIPGGEQPVADSLPIKAVPASGTEVASLSVIMVDSNDTDYPDIDVLDGSLPYVNKDGAKFCDASAQFDWGTYQVKVTMATEATENGSYEVVFPEGCLSLTSDAGDEKGGSASLTYTVVAPAANPKMVTVPADGSTVTSLSTISIYPEDTATYAYMDILSMSEISVSKDGEYFCGVKAVETAQGYDLTLKQEVTESGVYTVLLPADSWELSKNDGETDTFDLLLTYNVDMPGAKYDIAFVPTRFNPNSADDEPVDLDLYDGKVETISVKIDGALYPVDNSTVSVVCTKNKYSVEAPVRADAPKSGFAGLPGTTTFYFDLDRAIVQDGTYTISIPKGILGDADYKADNETGHANKAFVMDIEFTGGEPKPEPTVAYDLGYNSTQPGEGVVDISMVAMEVINLRIGKDYNIKSGATFSFVNSADTYSYSGTIREGYIAGNDRVLLLTVTEPSVNGTYMLTIPRGTFGDAEWLADPETGHTNPELRIYYRIINGQGTKATFDVPVDSTTPGEGDTVDISEDSFAQVKFTAVGNYDFVPGGALILTCTEAEYSSLAMIEDASYADGATTFIASIQEPVTTNGIYTLTIPEGVFGTFDYSIDCSVGNGNVTKTVNFTVTGGIGQKEPTVFDLQPTSVTPSDGSDVVLADGLDHFVFVFAEDVTAINNARATLRCSEANYYDTSYFQPDATAGTYTLTYLTKPSKEGTYTLTVPEGFFIDAAEAHANPELTYTYQLKTTGLQSVFGDATETGIYTIDGVKVSDTAEKLPAGIYVVKGKKVIVNK